MAANTLWKSFVAVSCKLVGCENVVLIKYFNVFVCGFFGMNNKHYKMNGMYIKMSLFVRNVCSCMWPTLKHRLDGEPIHKDTFIYFASLGSHIKNSGYGVL